MKPRKELPKRKLHRLSTDVYAMTDCEFHFTVCARGQAVPFHDPNLAAIVIESLLWTRKQHKWRLFCYCLMPDHLHFVARLTNEEAQLINTGSRGMQPEGILDHLARFKSYTTNRSWRLGFRGPLWQKSSYDRLLDLEKPFEEVVLYTLANPVRKELVVDWEDWPYSRIVDPWW